MTANIEYTNALWDLRQFMMKHGETVKAYWRDCKAAAKLGLTEQQVQIEILNLRNSGPYKNVLDMHVVLVKIKNRAREKSLTERDHPLYTPDIGDPSVEVPMNLKMMDEKNYDIASAKTNAEREEIFKNIRELDDMESMERSQMADQEARRAASEREYRQRFGEPTDENTEICPDCGRLGFIGHIKHSPRCGTLPGNEGRSAVAIPTSDAVEIALAQPAPMIKEELAADIAEAKR